MELLVVLIKVGEAVAGLVLYVFTSGQLGSEWLKNSRRWRWTARIATGTLAALLTWLALEPFVPIPKAEPILTRMVVLVIGSGQFGLQPPSTNLSPPKLSTLTAPQPDVGPAPNPKTLELEYWRSVEASDDINLFKEYVRRYPRGDFVGVARVKIAALGRPKLTPGARPTTTPTDRLSPIIADPRAPSSPTTTQPKCVPFNGKLVCG